MIDLHSHILPGLDDGARTMADTLAIATAAAGDGVRVLAATPHVRGDFPTSAETMAEVLAEVRQAVSAAGIELDVVPGGEIGLDRLGTLTPRELDRFGLGGNPHALLVEFPYEGWPLRLAEQLSALLDADIRPVLAHPERNPDVQDAPGRLTQLVEAGVLVQVTASSLTGRGGRDAERTAHALLKEGLCHLVASDVHSGSSSTRMSDARAAVQDTALGQWLTHDVPEAIMRGAEPPNRPASGRRRLRVPFRR